MLLLVLLMIYKLLNNKLEVYLVIIHNNNRIYLLPIYLCLKIMMKNYCKRIIALNNKLNYYYLLN